MQTFSFIGLLVVSLVLLLAVGYGYFIYSPRPAVPILSATIQQAAIQVGGRSRTYQAYVPTKLPPSLV